MTKKRLAWVDVTKGFLMILVVVGHFPGDLDHPLLQYIYWFHMPAFFVLSGLFFKPISKDEPIRKAVKKRFMQLMIPYLFFLLLITCIRYVLAFAYGNTDISWYVQDFSTLIIGGRYARGSYGVFWFTTVLFFTYLLFLLLTKYLSRFYQFSILTLCYIIAHIQSYFIIDVIGGASDKTSQTIPMLWNLDITLITVVYFAIGYYAKDLLLHIQLPLWTVCTINALLAMRLTWVDQFDYHLSLKFIHYNHALLDLIIPFIFIIAIFGIFQFITRFTPFKAFHFIEMQSVTIMYMHISVDKQMNNFFDYGLIGYTVLCLGISITGSIVIKKFIPYGLFFIGDIHAKRPLLFKGKLFTT
ncbi:acyltransferase family protein [Viridibacillus sp. NPDC096237]|uniref:acyltransferase family protein n=1 Tax=Viridibacillus sp. NPDC096237 TaxID=3390721 RepID=UPI003D092DBF